MQNFRKRLPPLDPLIAFEAAARHLSFTAAAGELSLSQAAVSQQIRNLERNLGIDLFSRSHRAVQLTHKGREFQHTVSAVLRQLAIATEELTVPEPIARLTLAADQSVASMWLMPRLQKFQQLNSQVSVRLIASDDEEECLSEDVDTAIIHGNGSWPGFRAEQIFGETVFPVCSPVYLEHHDGINSTEALAAQILLELEDNHWDWMTWRTWLSNCDVHLPIHHRALQVNSYPLLIEAARNGQGIALGWQYLVDDDLARGSLVRPLDTAVNTAFGYYLVWPSHKQLSHSTSLFHEWLAGQLDR